jgi:dimethylargininase
MPELTMAAPNNCFKYNFALVSRIAASFGEHSSFDMKRGTHIDIDKARREHEDLVEALRRIGLDVIELPCDEKHPDGLFVDDIAVVINGTALICNPPSFKNKPSRQGELAVVRQVLRKELGLKIVEVESETAFVEGGDVLWTGREIFVGLSSRTNMLGAQAVAKAFPEYPCNIVKVHEPAVHLKDNISMAGPEVIAVAKSASAQKTFQEIRATGGPGYKYISVEEDEAGNVIFCNGTLLHLAAEQIPKGFAVYENKIDYPRVAIHMEEPLKRGGRLSSCVLIINRVRHPKKFPTSVP